MYKYIPHITFGSLGMVTIFFKEFVIDAIQKAADVAVEKAKKLRKVLTKKRKFGKKRRSK